MAGTLQKKFKADKQRRFAGHYEARGARVPKSNAMAERRTMYPSTVVSADASPRVLVDGRNNSKLGHKVTVGAWKGMPIYQLTLEERATCTDTCHMWDKCYGNSMHMARRHKHGATLEAVLHQEIIELSAKHKLGFVVRLHLLGDFYSVGYVKWWSLLMHHYPQLHVFGFTARQPGTEIGDELVDLVEEYPDRFAMRWSIPLKDYKPGTPRQAVTVGPLEIWETHDIFVCPAQKRDDKCCATCAACWQSQRTVAFVEHGNVRPGRKKEL